MGRLGTYLSATTLALSAGVAVISAMPGVSLPPRAAYAVMALAAVALTVGVSKLRRDPDGARARAGARPWPDAGASSLWGPSS